MGDNQGATATQAAALELANAVLLIPEGTEGPAAKASQVLVEEVEKRTGITLPVVHTWPEGNEPVIVAGTEASLQELLQQTDTAAALQQLAAPGQEGYHLLAQQGTSAAVLIVGADDRGMLYGIGKFLRNARLTRGSIRLDANTAISSTPRQPIRGHQLGYRPKTNAYDAWSPEQFDQYIRELALFGANSIEVMPPRTDDDATGPLMKVDPLEMMIRLSETIHSYGLDTWVWYPNMAENYEDPETVRAEIAEREEIFSKVPHIHAVFIPGSDPGDLNPELLFEWSEQVSQLLQKHHPQARIWLSPQFMGYEQQKWLEGFLTEIAKEPEWLGGVVFGPHVDITLPELRKRVPDRYPIRRYEDITHNFHCQYPVQNWDLAYALTLGRESINPRPVAEKYIHNLLEGYASGNISYSEGINDDVNKFVWSDQDWDSSIPVIETLRDFARLFVGADYAEGVAQGLMALERNWEGPLLANAGVDDTLRQWQRMEQSAPPEVLNSYRFQMGLLRAYYDAYIRRRLIYETELESEAMDVLRSAPSIGALQAIERMESILRKSTSQPVSPHYRTRCWELADELFKNIGEQLSVVKHQAIALGRGAFMDAIDFPLNDALWLTSQCAEIKEMAQESDRLVAIDQLVNRTNPGPGGFYDNLGSYQGWQRVDPGKGWAEDPGYLESPRMAHGIYLLQKDHVRPLDNIPPLASVRHANTLADTPLVLKYDHLDPSSSYCVKVTYVGDTASELNRDYEVTLTAGGMAVHENVAVKQGQCTQIVSKIPREAITDGTLVLKWKRMSGFKRLNVSEVWVIRQDQ
ncbi:alpha-glucuronidase family glycosyl hydrolase [Paenibacillus thalictri]|uniref:Alpha glucuronidase N-terminal domain-containing protein n=1 Tax=Paenibacillus thalictri TaxID=2527873 RepID=A0A4Q9DLT3_9BACL|nr:alpha-glucuronidase family glycosyl hydrolase [Paenibacillus thalictri]TBL75012.1 hypothetical protein EYB31_23640 [Paenibacillus thalictri]